MKKTPLYDLHAELGAKFGPFAGYDMPLSFPAGIMTEHKHTREQAGLFDISHMVHVELSGPQAVALVERLCPYPADEQPIGGARYTFFLNETGGIIDDLIVTRLAKDRFRVVCNAGCAQKDIAHIRQQAGDFECKVDILDCAFLALQGPAAETILKDMGLDFSALSFRQATEPKSEWFASRTGYTGEDGFELAMPTGEVEDFTCKLVADKRVLPIGLAARDSLRLEAGLSLYGQDLAEDISPMEAGLAWAIPKSHREGGGFVGADAIAAKFAKGRARKRIGLKPQGGTPVRAHAPVSDASGQQVGEVTSGGFGPTAGHPVALALIKADAAAPFTAEVRGKQVPLEEVKLPFVPHRYKR